MQILITGASGFAGKHAARYLLLKGYRVIGMCRTRQAADDLKRQGIEPLLTSLEDIAAADLVQVDVVVHCAALLGQWAPYVAYYQTNVEGTRRMLQLAAEAGVKRFIHISTESVLFSGKPLKQIDESYPYPETDFYYSKSKQEAEKLVLEAGRTGPLETVVLRPRMIWGPPPNPLLDGMVAAIQRNRFIWLNHGRALTSTTHVTNLAHAVYLCCFRPEAAGRVFFVTDREIKTLRDFWSPILKAAGLNPPWLSLPAAPMKLAATFLEWLYRKFNMRNPPPITRMSAAVFSTECTINASLIEEVLGYVPVITYEAGVTEIAANFGKAK